MYGLVTRGNCTEEGDVVVDTNAKYRRFSVGYTKSTVQVVYTIAAYHFEVAPYSLSDHNSPP